MDGNLMEVVSEVFGVDEDDITPDTSPENLDNWDSMNHLKLVTAIEEEFSINLSMDEVEAIVDVKSLSDIVNNHAK